MYLKYVFFIVKKKCIFKNFYYPFTKKMFECILKYLHLSTTGITWFLNTKLGAVILI